MRSSPIRLALLAACLLLAAPPATLAERLVTEVIPLKYRLLQDVLPILRPLVARPGGISGMNDQLVVRATREDLEAVKQVLASIDKRPRTLMISVRQGGTASLRREEAEGFARIEGGDVSASAGSRRGRSGLTVLGGSDSAVAGARILDTRSEREDGATQRIRVLEGREAHIRTGESVPVGERQLISSGGVTTIHESVRYQDASTGFYVVPHLRGDSVLLVVSPHRTRFVPGGGGAIAGSEAHTTLTAPLGEWVELGGTVQSATDSSRGTLYSTRDARTQSSRVMVKVEVLGE